MITAITLTGNRPEAFELCKKWMGRQTVYPDQWIIIDDGEPSCSTEGLANCFCFHRKRNPSDPQFTMLINLKLALQYVKGDKIIFFEDDEYYAPFYIEEMNKRLDSYNLVGIGHSKYYHLPSGGYKQHCNLNHASLAQTGLRSNILSALNLNGNMFIDVRLWNSIIGNDKGKPDNNQVVFSKNQAMIFVDKERSLYCGVKGLPGRGGIGIGHKKSTYQKFDDSSRSVLQGWIPQDYVEYFKLLQERK